jgi:hypothetical protein
MKHLMTRGDDDKVRSGFHCLVCNVYHTWRVSFVGTECYFIIMHGISGQFHHEEVTEHDAEHYDRDVSDNNADIILGHHFYLVAQMLSTYNDWLCLLFTWRREWFSKGD